MDGKKCSKCYNFKSLIEFDRQPINKSRDGYRSSCKECNNENKKRHYQDNKVKYKQAYQYFMDRNPTYQKEYYLKKR